MSKFLNIFICLAFSLNTMSLAHAEASNAELNDLIDASQGKSSVEAQAIIRKAYAALYEIDNLKKTIKTTQQENNDYKNQGYLYIGISALLLAGTIYGVWTKSEVLDGILPLRIAGDYGLGIFGGMLTIISAGLGKSFFIKVDVKKLNGLVDLLNQREMEYNAQIKLLQNEK